MAKNRYESTSYMHFARHSPTWHVSCILSGVCRWYGDVANDSHIERLAGRYRALGIRSADCFRRAFGRDPRNRERAALAMAWHSRSAPNPMAQQHGRRAEHFALYTKRKHVRPDLPRVPLAMHEIRADERRAGVNNEIDPNSIHRLRKGGAPPPLAFGKYAVPAKGGAAFSGTAKNVTRPRDVDFYKALGERHKATDWRNRD